MRPDFVVVFLPLIGRIRISCFVLSRELKRGITRYLINVVKTCVYGFEIIIEIKIENPRIYFNIILLFIKFHILEYIYEWNIYIK